MVFGKMRYVALPELVPQKRYANDLLTSLNNACRQTYVTKYSHVVSVS